MRKARFNDFFMKDAIEALNSLQSNAAALEAQRKSGGRDLERQLPEMVVFLQHVGIEARLIFYTTAHVSTVTGPR